jgi:trimethylamine--corrinoid protein Co-methyltransferase
MHTGYVQFSTPQFRILSNKQLEEMHLATLQILERTGVVFQCQEAIEILGDAGADVSDTKRVKVPSYLVDQALRTAPRTISLFSRDGKLAMVLDGHTGSHFGGFSGYSNILDPYSGKQRKCYVDDIADTARVVDALPNIEWYQTSSANQTVPGAIADKVELLHSLVNTSKPVFSNVSDVSSLAEMIDLCSVIAGGEKQLRERPFFGESSEPVSPLVYGKDAIEKALLCAEKRIPHVVHPIGMAGVSTPATFAGCVAIANAEVLAELVVLQLKNPGTPVIFGGMPSIMDMKTTIVSYGAPEMSLMAGALAELSHYYGLPFFGTAGSTDAARIGAQAAAEVTNQILISALQGSDLVHGAGQLYHCVALSPELMVLVNEIIGMVRVLMRGIEINDETLPLGLIERMGPGSNYLGESHTRKHFREFWVPDLFDRSFRRDSAKDCEELLKKKTIDLMQTHKPKPLPDDLIKELNAIEKTWFDRVGLKHEYPQRPDRRQLKKRKAR